jgi:hypothetical protein
MHRNADEAITNHRWNRSHAIGGHTENSKVFRMRPWVPYQVKGLDIHAVGSDRRGRSASRGRFVSPKHADHVVARYHPDLHSSFGEQEASVSKP